MAYSRVQYTQTVAGNKTFVIPFPYLQRANIQVSDNGAVVTYTYVDAQTILLDVAPDVGSVVDVRRITPTEILVDYTDGSTLGERELDLTYRQTLFLSQEAIDKALDALQLGTDGTYDALGHRIKNLGTPVNPSDAVTKAYADSLLSAIQNQVDLAAGYAANAANSASNAASQAALAAAQVALAAAQVALAEAAADDAAAQVALAADQVALAESAAADAAAQVTLAADQVALAESAAADAAAQVLLAADQVGLAAAQVALAADHAADAAAAQAAAEAAAAEAAEGVAEAVLVEIEDKIASGELGQYPGVNQEDTLNQDIRKAYASMTTTESIDNFGFPDNTPLTNGDGKGILHPGLGAFAGKHTIVASDAAPVKLRFNTSSGTFQYASHANAIESWTDLSENFHGKPILVDGSGQTIVVGSIPSVVFVAPSAVDEFDVYVPGYLRTGMNAILRTTPCSDGNLSQSVADYKNAYNLIVMGDKTGGYETKYDCIQEILVQYVSETDPNERIFRTWARQVANFQQSFYGGDWKQTSAVPTGVFDFLQATLGTLTINSPSNQDLYYTIGVNGADETDKSLTISDNLFNPLAYFDAAKELSAIGGNPFIADDSKLIVSDITSTQLMKGPLATDTLSPTSYTKVGMGSSAYNAGSYGLTDQGSYTTYTGTSSSGTHFKSSMIASTDANRKAGVVAANGVLFELNTVTTTALNTSYAALFSRNGVSDVQGYWAVSGSTSSPSTQIYGYAYSMNFRKASNSNAVGSVDFFAGNAVAASDVATFSRTNGGGVHIHGDVTASNAAIRIGCRSTDTLNAIGVISSANAGVPGETAGVAPVRFEQNVSNGATRVWTSSNTTIGTDAQNSSTFSNATKTLTSITRMGKNRKMVTMRQRSATPDANGIITITIPESYKNVLHIGYQRDQDATGISVSFVPDSFNMFSATNRSTVSVGFVKATPATFTPATTALDCAGTLVFILEE